MQQTEQLLTAIERYLAGKATAAQRKMVNDWYHSFDDERVTVQTEDADYERLLDARLRIRIAESTGTVMSNSEEVKTVRLWPRIRIKSGMTGLIAAAVAAIVFGVWFFSSKYQDSSIKTGSTASVNDVAPGKNGATITLANGKVIELSDAKSGVVIGKDLKYNDGAAVQGRDPDLYRSSTARADDDRFNEVQTLTASTARGQTYQFTLPDGTKVWLNADSKISFPSQFSGQERKILLDGEGYFEVSKDKARPFIVQTKRQKIEVLGTHFNVSAYANDVAVKTTLLEGRVAVSGDGGKVTLDPGDQAYSGSDGLRAKTLSNPEAELDWKDGDFVFDNETLDQIMNKVSRWYDIDVSYEQGIDREQTFGGKVSRNRNISAVLKSMESTGKIRFKVEGKKVTVVK